MSSIHEEQERQVNRYGSLIAEESNGTQDYEMPQQDGMAVSAAVENRIVSRTCLSSSSKTSFMRKTECLNSSIL